MKKGKPNWQMAFAGVGMIAVSCLLYLLLWAPFPRGVLYYTGVTFLCVLCPASVYVISRKFFRRKK